MKVNKIFKLPLIICILFVSVMPVFSQMSVDPNDEFYDYAQTWEIRGLVKNLPPVRPYSMNSIKHILQEVVKRGSEKDREIALDYWNTITGKVMHVVAEGDGEVKLTKTDDDTDFDKLIWGRFALAGDGYLYKELLSVGYDLGVTARNKEYEKDLLPYAVYPSYDARQDSASLGPLFGYIDMNVSAAVGTSEFFLQGGVNRTGYGPFLRKGLTLNENGYHSGNLSYSIVKDKFSFTQQYSVIGATKSYDATKLKPNKYLAFHALKYKFSDRFSASYYESIVYGKRFDLSYFLPVPFMICQGLGGNSDNTQSGLLFEYKPFRNLLWATDLFIDDFDVNALAKGSLDSKNRFGLQTGLIYAPADSFCRKLSFTYTAIAPYTYSHWDYVDDGASRIEPNMYNYQVYNNNGIPIGSTYEPNTDVIEFAIDFKPTRNLHVDLATSFLRHANVCESDSDEEAIKYLSSDFKTYATDGGILTHPMFSSDGEDGEHVETAWKSLNFLNQEHKMYVVQAKINVDYTLPPTKVGQLTINFGNTFEYVHNKGVDANIYDGIDYDGNNIKKLDNGKYTVGKDATEYTKDEIISRFRRTVDGAKRDWINNFTNEINDYIYIGITYKF